MLSSRYYSASRLGTDVKPRTALVVDDDDELYSGFNEVSPALDTRALREDQHFQEAIKTAGRRLPTRIGTGLFRGGTVSLRAVSSRAGTAARPMTAVRAAGYTSTATPAKLDKDDSVEDKVKAMEGRIMKLVEESCMLSARPDPDDDTNVKREYDSGKALAKAQEASALERQLIRMQEQANLGDSHNLDLTFSVLLNLASQYALNEMYTEALNTYQLLTRNKLFPHANRLKVNMGNIYFKMGEHPKALKLYRMALDQTPTAEKDLRMKVMHNIGLLLVRMGKFRDAVTNFQHIMHEQGDFETGLHLVLCSVALNDAEGGKAAFHAMLDVEPPTYHQDIDVDDENDALEAVVRDVARGDRLARWARRGAARAERCLALAAAALAQRDHDGMGWCVDALRGGGGGGAGGGAGARLEASAALAALRAAGGRATNAGKVLQRLKALARAHPEDRVVCAEANADAAFVAYALGQWSEAAALSAAAVQADPYCGAARVTAALAAARTAGTAPPTADLAAAAHLDPSDLLALHNLALSLEQSGGPGVSGAAGRWVRVRGAGGAGATLRAFAAAGLARAHRDMDDHATAEHWYSTLGSWDVGVATALAELHSEMGDTQAAKHHYQDVESVWPCSPPVLQWLGEETRALDPVAALHYYRRAARLQPGDPQWGLLMGACLRANGRYQEALTLYKRMNARFPDNVQCLKLIVKLCGDQGLAETGAWSRELRAVVGRGQRRDGASIPSAGSASSSNNSQSPNDHSKGSGAVSSLRGRLTPASPLANKYGAAVSERDRKANVSRPGTRKTRTDDFDDDLPLPPE